MAFVFQTFHTAAACWPVRRCMLMLTLAPGRVYLHASGRARAANLHGAVFKRRMQLCRVAQRGALAFDAAAAAARWQAALPAGGEKAVVFTPRLA